MLLFVACLFTIENKYTRLFAIQTQCKYGNRIIENGKIRFKMVSVSHLRLHVYGVCSPNLTKNDTIRKQPSRMQLENQNPNK